MTVGVTTSSVVIAGNGANTQFSFTFPTLASWIVVTFISATGVQTVIPSTQYTLALNAIPAGQVWAPGGTVTYNPSGTPIAAGTSLMISRVVPETQLTSLINQAAYYPQVVEAALDTLCMQNQAAVNAAARAIVINPADLTLPNPLPVAATRANQLLGFDSTGQPTTYSTPNYSATTVQATGGTTLSTLAQRFSHILNIVDDFGAVGDGATNNTTAFSNAFSALSTTGGVLLIPPGVFCYTTLAVPANVSLVGQGVAASVLKCTQLTSTAITLGGANIIRDIQFTATSARTSGATISVQGNDVQIDNCEFVNYFVGIVVGTISSLQAVFTKIVDCSFFLPAIGAGSGAIQFSYYSNGVVSRCSIVGTASGNQPDFGIQLDYGDTVLLSDCNITRHGAALICETSSGQGAYATMAVNCLFDSAGTISSGTAPCCYLAPAGTMQDVQFSNCWFSLSAGNNGCLIQPSGSGIVEGVDFSGCKFVGNSTNGLQCYGTGVSGVTVSGGDSAGNSGGAGLNFGNGATAFTVTGHRAGNSDGRGANNYGIVTSGAGNNYVIVGNNLTGNTTGNLSDGASGSNKVVANNLTT